jgi:hypothetical protein
MDRIVYQALKEGRNPRIYFRFDDLTLTRRPTTNDAAFLLEADNELVAAGVTNLSRVPLSVEPLGNKQLRISGAMTLRMSDFGIKPPEGKGADFTIKTGDQVRVRFDWLLAPEATASADSTLAVPPFMAEGSIISSNHFSTIDAKFSFFSSNGWWQVNLTNFTTPQSYHCMSIPGGVRWYVTFPHVTNLPAGTAAPISFPPPGIAGGMLQTWLCLCPRPKLPLIDDTRMHRFLTVPFAPFEILKDFVNQGTFHVTYLEPGSVSFQNCRSPMMDWRSNGIQKRSRSGDMEPPFTRVSLNWSIE